jgi:hypothetical protein
MSISLKQLLALSEEFEFDYNEARRFLGHSEPKKRGRPAKKVDRMVDSDSDQHSISPERRVKKPPAPRNDHKSKKQEKPRSEVKKPGRPSANKPPASKGGCRAPSGYNLFVKHQGKSITESAKEWKALSEAKRASWNSKAAAKEKSIFDIFG